MDRADRTAGAPTEGALGGSTDSYRDSRHIGAGSSATGSTCGSVPNMTVPTLLLSPEARQARLRRVVALINDKGGVGKTTLTVNLAGQAAAAGYRVLLIDLNR